MKILLSARDPGAADHIMAVAKKAYEINDYNVYLYAATPAFEIMQSKGLPVKHFDVKPAKNKDGKEAEILLSEANKLYEAIEPDVVLVGVSGPDAGVDEALLVKAKTNHTYAIQDFWGYVNTIFSKKASTYFVLDVEAAELSRKFHGVKAKVVGSPKHTNYSTLNVKLLGDETRKYLNVVNDRLLVGFFGQPLYEIEGYKSTINEFAASIKRVYPTSLLLFRPHPKESDESITESMNIFKSFGLNCVLSPDKNIEGLLSGCDIICTPFSNCGYDLLFLNKYSMYPLGTVVFLLFNAALKQFYSTYNKINYIPIAKNGMALVVEQIQKLDGILSLASKLETREFVWEKVNASLPDPERSADLILEIISSDLKSFKNL